MAKSTSQRSMPVAFWQRKGVLWIEFSDGHCQGFRSLQVEDAKAQPRKRSVTVELRTSSGTITTAGDLTGILQTDLPARQMGHIFRTRRA